jgi:hypothetical protein
MDESEGRTRGEDPEEGTGGLADEPTAPEGEEPTEVATPSENAATEVRHVAESETLPATPTAPGEAGAPPSQPPRPPQPTVMISQPPRSGGPHWIWWVVFVGLLILAAAAVWFLFLRSTEEVTPALSPSPLPSSSPLAWAGAWSRMDGTGGGLVVAGGDGSYEVTLYDVVLRPGESVPATLNADGTELQFALPSQFSVGGPSGPFAATLTIGDDSGRATLVITDTEGTSVLMPLQRVPELTPTNPSVSPSASASPSGVESPPAP